MKENKEIQGIIYPLRERNFGLLKQRENPVYVKYLTHGKSNNPTKLKKDHFLFFYLSKKNQSVVGYSKIFTVQFEKSNVIINNHLNKIQMNEKEFKNYIADREDKPLLFIELKKVIEFDKPVKLDSSITMTGKYILKSESKELFGV